MKKIACVGYHYTGSGVIDDLLRECDNVAQGKYESESRLLHDPDGISDLEYHLVENPHRLTSALAIRRFIRYCKRNNASRRFFGEKWDSLILEYVESLALIKFKGWLYTDIEFMPLTHQLKFKFERVLEHFKPNKLKHDDWYDYFPNNDTYYSKLTEEDFLQKTKKLLDNLCECANERKLEYLVLDQFIPTHNTTRYLRYINDLKVIIVDRDPRDLFIYLTSHNDHRLPKDPAQFAVQYRKMREVVKEDDESQVLRLRFEDLIYNYNDTIKEVFDFVGIEPAIHHVHPGKFFNPSISIKGTQLWKKHPEYESAIKVIEKELPEFLYSYPNLL